MPLDPIYAIDAEANRRPLDQIGDTMRLSKTQASFIKGHTGISVMAGDVVIRVLGLDGVPYHILRISPIIMDARATSAVKKMLEQGIK